MLEYLQKLQKNKPLYFAVLGAAGALILILSFVLTCSTSEACKKTDPPIVGKWLLPETHGTYTFSVDGTMVEGFLEDDNYSNVNGTYTFEEGMLTTSLNNQLSQRPCVINGDVMTWTIEGADPCLLYRIGGGGSVIGTWESLDDLNDGGRTYIFEEGQLLLDYGSYAYSHTNGKIYIYDYYDDSVSYNYDVLDEEPQTTPSDESGETIIGEEPQQDLVMNCIISKSLMLWEDNNEYIVLIRTE